MAKTFDSKGKLVNDQVDHKLGAMPIGRLLFKMSAPMMVSMLMLALYNVVDSIFVSRVSEAALSALSLAYPIQFLMVALNIGTNVGVTALVSRSLGEKNFENANSYARHGLIIAFIYFIIFAVLGYFFTDKFFHVITNDVAIQKEGISYLSIITVFSFGFFIETTYEKIMQANGKSIGSMITQLSGAIFNIIFDPILIFGLLGFPALGTKGAAIATVGGQIFGTFVGYFLNKYTNRELDTRLIKFKLKDTKKSILGAAYVLDTSNLQLHPKMVKNIYIVALPSIIMQAISSFTIFGLNMILTKYESAVAVLGVYYKIQSFVFMPVFGLNNGMVPIVSYNFGSHNKERIKEVIKASLKAAFTVMMIGSFIVSFFAKNILHLFNASDNMVRIGTFAFRAIAIHFPIAGFNIILSSIMQATKKEIYSLVASVIRQLVFLVPSAYILSSIFGVNGTWFCFFISELMAFIIIITLFMKTYKERILTL